METIFNCKAKKIDSNTDRKELTNLYGQAVDEGRKNGYTPVFVAVNDVLEETIEGQFGSVGSAEEYVKSVLSENHSNGKEIFEHRYSYIVEEYGDGLEYIDRDMLDKMLPMPENEQSTIMPSVSDYEGDLYLVQIPTLNPYEIFAWLPFGGWNECPDTDDMIAMCKYWYESYGAVPMIITYDTLTFKLDEPITDIESALNAAKEQLAFCEDIADYADIEELISMTYNNHYWSFWWD